MEKDKELLAINKDKANELKEQAEYDESYWKDEIWRYSLPVYFASDDGAVDKDKNEIP